MASLYELTGQMAYLHQLLEDPEAEEQVILDTMEGIDFEIEEKADGYAKIIRMLTAEVDAISSEVDRLTVRKKAISNNIDRLKSALEQSMIFLDKRKFKTALFSFNIQKNPATVNIVGPVPKKYLIPQEPKVDKKAIIEYVKAHGNTKYAELTQSESLRIR